MCSQALHIGFYASPLAPLACAIAGAIRSKVSENGYICSQAIHKKPFTPLACALCGCNSITCVGCDYRCSQALQL